MTNAFDNFDYFDDSHPHAARALRRAGDDISGHNDVYRDPGRMAAPQGLFTRQRRTGPTV